MMTKNTSIFDKTLKIIFLFLSLIHFFLDMCKMNRMLTYNGMEGILIILFKIIFIDKKEKIRERKEIQKHKNMEE